MARIRTIKPEFFTSEDIVGLSPLARLLFIATWCEADKAGRLRWKPGTFKLRYLPGDAADVHQLCAELVNAGLVVLYGDGLAYIPKFHLHQHINPRESESTLPAPTGRAPLDEGMGHDPGNERLEECSDDPADPACGPDSVIASLTREHASSTRADASILELTDREEGKGREGKGKEGETLRASALSPPGFDRFWLAYPKKRARGDAEKAWTKLKPGAELINRILEAVEAAKRGSDWLREGGQYVPYPATWLNRKGWLDEPDDPPSSGRTSAQHRLPGGFVA